MTISPRLAFFSTVATFAYLGLAVLGWGGFAAFFSHPCPDCPYDRPLGDVWSGVLQLLET